MKKMKVTAVIPARGGSVAVPRKNIALLDGKPLIAHAIQQAHDSQLVSEVVVSTEDNEIASVSEDYGASVIKRPPDLAQQHIDVWNALRSVASRYKVEGRLPDLFVEIHTTYPLRPEGLIDQVIDHAIHSGRRLTIVASPMYDKIWRKNKSGYQRLATDIKIAVRQRQEHLYRTHYGLVNVYNQSAALCEDIPFDMNPDLFIVGYGYSTLDINNQFDLDLIRHITETKG